MTVISLPDNSTPNMPKNISVNLSSPRRDQHQFSPNNINAWSHRKDTRFDKMIAKGKPCFDRLTNSLNLFCKEIYGGQSGEFESGYWDLKG